MKLTASASIRMLFRRFVVGIRFFFVIRRPLIGSIDRHKRAQRSANHVLFDGYANEMGNNLFTCILPISNLRACPGLVSACHTCTRSSCPNCRPASRRAPHRRSSRRRWRPSLGSLKFNQIKFELKLIKHSKKYSGKYSEKKENSKKKEKNLKKKIQKNF